MKNRTVFLALAVALCATTALGTVDVAVQVASPTGSQAPGSVPVVVLLTNVGDVSAAVPRVDVKIMPSGYQDFRENVSIGVGGNQPVSLSLWNYAGGIETCTAWITYPDDANHANDTAVVIVGGGGILDRTEKEPRAGMSLTLSPSPAAGNVLHVEYSLNRAGPAKVTLFDISGRVALACDFIGARAGELPLGLRGLKSGVYLVRLDDGHQSLMQELAVLR